MTLCVNPSCNNESNREADRFCRVCGSELLLRSRYRPVRFIGEGGFGRTFLAVDQGQTSPQKCVVKQLSERTNVEGNREAKQLFETEALRLQQVGGHPRIPMLLDHFEQAGHQYLTQEYIDGWDLEAELAAEGTFDENKIWQVLVEVSAILRFVHERQIIHRDIKPRNIMRQHRGGHLVLIDFGVAKLLEQSDLKTGTLVGSPEYMAPEQVQGKVVDSSDLYSLGVTCVYLLSGRSPLELYSSANDFWYWREALPQGAQVGHRLGAILDRLLETPLENRFRSAKDLSFHLMACQVERNSQADAASSAQAASGPL